MEATKISKDETPEFAESIINTVREPLIVLDHDLRVVSASRSFYDVFQVNSEETMGQLIYDLGNKQWNIPKLRELLETILPQKTTFDDYEVEHDFAGIGRRIMLLNARQIERVSGKERIILLAIEDITERRQLETLLANSENRYRRLFETANDGILLLEKHEGIIIHANPAIKSMLGYSDKELSGKHLKDVGFPDDMETIQEILQTLEQDGILHHKDTPIQKKAGQVLYTDIYMVDKMDLLQCNVRDITERKQAEAASKAFLDNIINTIADPIFVKDDQRRFVLVNEAFCAIVGLPKEGLIGKNDETIFSKEEAEVFRKRDISVLDTGREDENEEFMSNLLSGEVRSIVTRKTRYVDPTGNRFLVGVIRDITERNRALEEKAKLEARLQQAQKMEAIGTLAGGIAHDFNNILTAILGYTELAISGLPQESDTRENLEEVFKASLRAIDLVKQILTFSSQSEKLLFPVSIRPVINEALKLLRASLPATIEIHQDIRASGKVLANVTQIHQIMMNLCTNASHAMSENGGTLTVSLIKVNLPDDNPVPQDLPLGPYLKLTVSDTGCGMTTDELSRIFEPYYTTKGNDKGTGLGLAVVHGIVESHGGFITVESDPGKGSRFHVYLPEIMDSEKDKEMIRAVPPDATGTERILMVDDEPSILQVGHKILKSLGYQVFIAANGLEALELFKATPAEFDLVITDMTMPYMTGDQLAGKLIAIRPDIPIILCSGFSEKMTEEAAKKIGIREFIMKPISRHILSKTIRKVLDSNE